MNLSYHKDPFPHLIGSLDESLYNEINSSWVEHTNHIPMTGNRSNIPMPECEIKSKLRDIIFFCHQQFANDYIECYPKLIDTPDFDVNPRVLYSENMASEEGYKIRGLHLDTGDKHLVGLWYFKHPDERDDGGDLILMNPITKEHKLVKYESNVLVIFPNVMTSWHAVTPRKPSKYPRRYINLLLESSQVKLHNYQRTGTTVDSEFRGKLVSDYT